MINWLDPKQELNSTTFALKIALYSNLLSMVRDMVMMLGFIFVINSAVNRIITKVDAAKTEVVAAVTETFNSGVKKYEDINKSASGATSELTDKVSEEFKLKTINYGEKQYNESW